MTSAIQRPPMTAPIGKVTPGGLVELTPEWKQYLSRLGELMESGTESGSTGQRPTTELHLGQMYFDLTLGKPVWLKQYSVGSATWVDATGATV